MVRFSVAVETPKNLEYFKLNTDGCHSDKLGYRKRMNSSLQQARIELVFDNQALINLVNNSVIIQKHSQYVEFE